MLSIARLISSKQFLAVFARHVMEWTLLEGCVMAFLQGPLPHFPGSNEGNKEKIYWSVKNGGIMHG